MTGIRDMGAADLPLVLELNNQHAQEVNELSHVELERLIQIAARARMTADGSGFVIAYDETTPPQGPNHAWFLARQSPFLYIDRVVVAAAARGRGLARALYEDLATSAAGRPLCCEVNIDPPNPHGLSFHDRLGFTACGEAVDPRNGKRVRYLLRV